MYTFVQLIASFLSHECGSELTQVGLHSQTTFVEQSDVDASRFLK